MKKLKLNYFLVTSFSVMLIKLFTDILKLNVKSNDFVKTIVTKIGNLNGIYTQSATNWNPSLDKLINFAILMILFFLMKNFVFKNNKTLSPMLISLTLILGLVIFSSNILTNDYRGWDLFLYCEISPKYDGSNPYLKDINGLTSVYSPLVWNILYKVCNIDLINKIIYSYYIWLYTGFGILTIFLIRNQKINFQNICINLGIVLTFLGTNYHGVKTGNIGYLLGLMLSYCFLVNTSKSKNKLSSVIMGVLLTTKPFYLFWFVLLVIFSKLFRIKINILNNLNLIFSTILALVLINFLFFKKEFVYFLENLLQLNTSINKPLNDKAGFLNLNFQDYLHRVFERYFEIEINIILTIVFTVIILYYFKSFFVSKNNMILLPIFLTPRFKSYDLSFLFVLFRQKNIYTEYIFFCTIHSFIFIVFSFTGAGYLIEIAYILIFLLYLKVKNT